MSKHHCPHTCSGVRDGLGSLGGLVLLTFGCEGVWKANDGVEGNEPCCINAGSTRIGEWTPEEMGLPGMELGRATATATGSIGRADNIALIRIRYY